jgi:hypothetical protein
VAERTFKEDPNSHISVCYRTKKVKGVVVAVGDVPTGVYCIVE